MPAEYALPMAYVRETDPAERQLRQAAFAAACLLFRVRETDPAERQLRRALGSSFVGEVSLEKQTQPKGN